MTGYTGSIEEITMANRNFRQVVYTGKHAQVVVMCLQPNEEIGPETHPDTDQFFRFELGSGKVIIDGEEHNVSDGDAAVVPAGAQHNVMNTSSELPLLLYTIYSPPHHPDGTIQKTKTG